MPLPMTSLDDRRFDDLVSEMRQRLQVHLPDVPTLAEGDPLYALTDLFAWMTESVIYRANLIPERQRRAFLNLLHLPLRPATPAHGIIAIDAKPKGATIPALIPNETRLAAGNTLFTGQGELQPLPLALAVMVKKDLNSEQLRELGFSDRNLRQLYGVRTRAFQPVTLTPGQDLLSTQQAQDKRLYCLLYLPEKKQLTHKTTLRDALAGQILNIGLAPNESQPGDIAEDQPVRKLNWHIAWQQNTADNRATYLPLEVLDDTSAGGRKTGVVRLRLPKSTAILSAQFASDSKYAGMNNTPPAPPAAVDPQQVIAWLTVSAPDETPLELAYMTINALEVAAQNVVRDQIIGRGNGRPGQTASLNAENIDAASLVLEVSEQGSYVTWQAVSHFAASGSHDRVYRLDPASGLISFGDGIRGKRPEPDARIRAAYYRSGGGSAGNLPAGSIKQLLTSNASLYQPRHEWPTQNGLDAETVLAGEQRIAAHLNHRQRAVTREDFEILARDNPVTPVARAMTVPGLLPGHRKEAIRTNVPGVVSVFVLPPGQPALAAAPRPSAGLLRDVYHYLDARKMIATELYVLSPEFVRIALSVSVEVLDPNQMTQTHQAVVQALLDFLWALPPGGPNQQGWPMGRRVEENELKTAAARVSGVLAVNQLRLFYQAEDSHWPEVSQVALTRFQLPEVMSIDVEEGEQSPQDPTITQPGSGSGNEGDDRVPVPVIPDLC